MNFLFTCDVELTSIPENRESDHVADEVLHVGLPRVLELCSRLDVATTFYFTANIVEARPECLDLVRQGGHEIGCHGLSHNPVTSYDGLPYDDQVQSLIRARSILKRFGAGQVRSFRAPEARINEDTVRALSHLGFTSDSSVCPQRFDGLLSRGFRRKLRWLVAPRHPYFLSSSSVVARGTTEVLEIPISALLVPFIGTTLRISPSITRWLSKALFAEAHRDPEYPVVFLFHPNECLDYTTTTPATVSGSSVVADRLRTSLKLRNLGLHAVDLVGELLRTARAAGFDFATASILRSQFKQEEA